MARNSEYDGIVGIEMAIQGSGEDEMVEDDTVALIERVTALRFDVDAVLEDELGATTVGLREETCSAAASTRLLLTSSFRQLRKML